MGPQHAVHSLHFCCTVYTVNILSYQLYLSPSFQSAAFKIRICVPFLSDSDRSLRWLF